MPDTRAAFLARCRTMWPDTPTAHIAELWELEQARREALAAPGEGGSDALRALAQARAALFAPRPDTVCPAAEPSPPATVPEEH